MCFIETTKVRQYPGFPDTRHFVIGLADLRCHLVQSPESFFRFPDGTDRRQSHGINNLRLQWIAVFEYSGIKQFERFDNNIRASGQESQIGLLGVDTGSFAWVFGALQQGIQSDPRLGKLSQLDIEIDHPDGQTQ